ncbi:MAG: hypothetical protein AB7I50_15955 [Vicinamibacterales bacterium]
MIELSPRQIEIALPRVEGGLKKYWWLQSEYPSRNVVTDLEYQRAFVGFYRVRRSAPWREAFFRLLEEGKTRRPTITEVLHRIHEATGRIEASFASKLVATADPDLPVIDSVVLRNLGRRLPTGSASQRIRGIASLHERLAEDYTRFLDTALGGHLVTRFTATYPRFPITTMKMLDLVIWQIRDEDGRFAEDRG